MVHTKNKWQLTLQGGGARAPVLPPQLQPWADIFFIYLRVVKVFSLQLEGGQHRFSSSIKWKVLS